MEWTDEIVKVFTQVYSSNFSAGCVQEFEKKYKDFVGRKINQKMEIFKNVIRKMYKESNPLGLEFLEEKYCGEVEIWKKDDRTFEVPIDVHRDFSSMVEI